MINQLIIWSIDNWLIWYKTGTNTSRRLVQVLVQDWFNWSINWSIVQLINCHYWPIYQLYQYKFCTSLQLINWSIDQLISWLINWSIDQLINQLINWSIVIIDQLINCTSTSFVQVLYKTNLVPVQVLVKEWCNWSINWSIDQLIDQLINQVINWSIDQLIDQFNQS